MFRRILAAICIFCILFSLAACQKNEPDKEKKETTEETQKQTAPATQPTETEETAPEVTEPPVAEIPEALILAREAIAASDYETAYRYLYECEEKTEEVEALLSCFAFVPVKEAPKETDTLLTAYTYDENGYIVKYEYKENYEGNISVVITYTHDEKGNVLTEHSITDETGMISEERISCTYDDNGNVLWQHTQQTRYSETTETEVRYTYDDRGNAISASRKYNGGDWQTTTYAYIYDGKGRLTTKTEEDPSGYWKKTVFTYDTKGNLIKERYDTSTGSWFETNYTYDKMGNLLTETNNKSDNIATSRQDKYTYTYDEKGNLIYSCQEWGQNKMEEVITYDGAGNAIERITTMNDTPSTRKVYTYDAKGNVLTRIHYNLTDPYYAEEPKGYINQYTYDDFGNVTVIKVGSVAADGSVTFSVTTEYTSQLQFYPCGVPEQVQEAIDQRQIKTTPI